MQEVTVTSPAGKGETIARLALECGLSDATVVQVRLFEDGKMSDAEEIKVATSAPMATQFIEAVMSAPFYDPEKYSIVGDDVSAVAGKEPSKEVARPMKLAAITVLQELWQENHITPAYIARAGVSTLLLAYGMLSGDITMLIIALLFTPFLSQVLAVALGGWTNDWKLVRQALLVIGLSTVISVLAGFIVATVIGGPLQFEEFGTVQSNFAISFLVGIIAGLDTADEAGRREFVAVAGAAQFASFPVWFGIALVIGFPDRATTLWRLASFAVNILTILIVSLVVYIALRYRRDAVSRFNAATHAQ